MHLMIVLLVQQFIKNVPLLKKRRKEIEYKVLDETAVYEAVKEILVRNKRDIEWIRCMNVGSYLDIKAFIQL